MTPARLLPLLLLVTACGASAPSPPAGSDASAGGDAGDAAPEVDVREVQSAAWWRERACGIMGFYPRDTPALCAATPPPATGPDAWCDLRDVRDGDTGLVPWAQCLEYSFNAVNISTRDRWSATCPPPASICGGPCPGGRRVFYGRTVQQFVQLARHTGTCWPEVLPDTR